MLVNFPLWIVAKRMSAGVGMPPLRELYKGSGSLYVAMGPMVVVQDGSTSVALRALEGKLEPTAAFAASACASGAVGALVIGSQIEGLITRAHATGATIVQTASATHATGGAMALALPHGAVMTAAREIPYAGCLFFLSGWIRERLHGRVAASEGGGAGGGSDDYKARVARDVLGASLTACVAGPISHVPSVIAAYQQAHALSISAACKALAATGGVRAFFGGLLPRTVSLAGSLFVMPFTIEALTPHVEKGGRIHATLARWKGAA